ncbi:MAG TPA: hypothetical protein VKS20_15955 [Candidatus Acidoferrales bacterium]|nr:hypothetical protein [Candidatus Acidoferrales bacterium]
MPVKLKLGENHRRVVSVLLRGLERACDEIDAALHDSDSPFRRVNDDLTAAQRQTLQKMTEKVRAELRRISSEVELDVSVHSRRRRIRALLSTSIVNLEESTPDKLRGYGEMDDAAKIRLQTEFERLLDLLNAIESALDQV